MVKCRCIQTNGTMRQTCAASAVAEIGRNGIVCHSGIIPDSEKSNNYNSLQTQKIKNILIAPLDWGLGHATRCIPIITVLLETNSKIIIAANGTSRSILKEAFPQVSFIAIPDYNINYGKTKAATILNLVTQFPKIKKAISAEKKWLEETVKDLEIDIVISDNRYGLSNKNVQSVFITHQLKPKSFFGNFGEQLLQKILYDYINKFTYCWVMDSAGDNNLAGALSHPDQMPDIPAFYIGPLSRLIPSAEKEKYGYCILLSGPEPQRTILEKMMLKQLQNVKENGVLVRGLPDDNEPINTNLPKLTVYNYLNTIALSVVLAQSRYIISRSGYSSVMDLLLLRKKCIFIPTPGQTEQQYLAKYLEEKRFALAFGQNTFDIEKALQKAAGFQYITYEKTTEEIPVAKRIEKLLNQ